MKDKFPEIFKNKIDNVKSKIQKEYYYHASSRDINNKNDDVSSINKIDLLKKINNIFKRPDFVYQTDITIMYKNGESIKQRVIAMKENYLLTIEGEKIYISDIKDIK